MNYKHFNTSERSKIECLLKLGLSIRQIAAQIGRHYSSVSREIQRNSNIKDQIKLKFSPEQITGRILYKKLSFKTIYGWIHKNRLPEITLKDLRQKGKRIKQGDKRKRDAFDGMTIHERPVEVKGREVAGHWEGDIVVSGRGKS